MGAVETVVVPQSVFYLLAALCGVAVALHLRGIALIRRDASTQLAHKIDKTAIACVYTVVGIGYLTGASADPRFRFLTLGIVILFGAASGGILRWSSRHTPPLTVVRTLEGRSWIDARIADRLGDIVAGLLRHGFVADPIREAIREALGVPPAREWTAALRDEMRERRALLGREPPGEGDGPPPI